jgi:hypothetical protein
MSALLCGSALRVFWAQAGILPDHDRMLPAFFRNSTKVAENGKNKPESQ